VSSARQPRFQVGDHVRIVWPERLRTEHESGTVTEVVVPTTDKLFRYRVTFPDGTIETFFGFELQLES
jgi:hypothetical protein